MPKQVPASEFEALLQVIRGYPDGAALAELAADPAVDLPRRTLQRRLQTLVSEGRLHMVGRGRGSRYLAAAVAALPDAYHLTVRSPGPEVEVYPPLSAEGQAIKDAIRAPIQDRDPVGYQRDFLERYRPNQTAYLSDTTRRHLAAIGRSGIGDQPAGTFARQIYQRLLIDLTWNSSRLEGNTYSLLETERLLSLGEAAEGKEAFEAQMILNHKDAIDLLLGSADEIGFNRYTILNLHALLSNNLMGDPEAVGRLRTVPVGIAGTVYEPLAVPQLIDECFQKVLDTANAIADPFEQAFFTMAQLPYLQPFEDVNKRVSRLAANLPLVRDNFCPLSFVDVPSRAYVDGILGVYELNRVELLRDVFVWAYERSCARYSAVVRSLGEPDVFRLKHRRAIADAIREIVLDGMDKTAAVAFLRRRAPLEVEATDVARFIEVVESELMGLHAGNIARYRLKPAEFEAWQRGWV